MRKTMRAAIVGFGGMGQRHYKAYQGTSMEVTAICEWNPDRVKAIVPDFPDDKIYKDYREMIARESIDVLSVASNGPTHAPIAIDAAEAGVKRILIEKPMATSVAEAEQVIAAAERAGARISVNLIRRWSDSYRELKKRIDDGTYGPVRHVYYHSGSTGLGNFVIHAFDTMRMLGGTDAAWVTGALDPTGTPNPRGADYVDPAGFGMVMFANGMRGLVDSGEDTGLQYLLVVATPHARIEIDELNTRWRVTMRTEESRKTAFTRYGNPMEEVEFPQLRHDIVALTSRALVELAGDGPLSCTVEDGLKSLEMVIAFHESQRRGNTRVDLPLTGDARDLRVMIA